MPSRCILLIALAACLPITASHAESLRPKGDESATSWFRAGAERAHAQGAGNTQARNVILFVGDGMSLTTVAAARILEGQRRGESGEENQLAFETFPYTALSRTYNTDSQTPDSAGTMTAMVTGVKARRRMLSVAPEVAHRDCKGALAQPLTNLLELAEHAGLGTGLVTTTRVTHATPGASFGHSADRYWESDTDMSAEAKAAGCTDLARQLVEFDHGDGVDVVMGGGRMKFLPARVTDPEYPELTGERKDQRHLINEWQTRHPAGRYVWKRGQLDGLGDVPCAPVLALFEPDHMRYEHDRSNDPAGEPSLAEMTAAAIALLSKQPNGYVLIVEGGRIDHAHHDGNAYRALTDTVAFSDAVRAARDATSEADTLILVTADHSHTLSFAGYPERGNPILGKVRGASSEDARPGLAKDQFGLPFTTLTYANGPGYQGNSDHQRAGPKSFPHKPVRVSPVPRRANLARVNTQDPNYLQEALIALPRETHGGDDVGIWASGPGAAAVRGSLEQNVIFHLLVQTQPALRAALCQRGSCDEDGVPRRLPARAQPAR